MALALLAACASPPEDTPDDGGPDDTAPDEPCEVDDAAFSSLRVEPTGIPTVARASWSTTLTGSAVVEFGDGTRALETPDAPDGSALIVGVGPLRDVTWRVRVTDGDHRICSQTQTWRTGALDPRLPERTVLGDQPSGDYVVTTVLTNDTGFVTVLDPSGEIVWATPVTEDPPGGPFRAQLARGGGAILYAHVANAVSDAVEVVRIGLDGATTTAATFTGGHTDMVELPDGTIAMLGWEIREVTPGRRFLGDTIVEVGADGVQREIWNAFEALTVDLTGDYANDFYRADPDVEDWSHANGLHYDEVDATYYVTVRGTQQLARVGRDGTTAWTVGPAHSTVPSDLIRNPHSVERLPDGSLLVFNGGKQICSTADRLVVDAEARVVTAVASYTSADCLNVVFLGDTRRQSDGSVRVSWSSSGRLETFAEDGRSLQTVDLPVGAIYGFIDVTPDLYKGP